MRSWVIAALIAAVGLGACSGDGRLPNACGMPAPGLIVSNALDVLVRDSYGRGQAIGTSALVRSPSDTQTFTGYNDTLHIFGGYGWAGTYSVTLHRPYYQDFTVSNITVKANDQCPVLNTVTVPVVLSLAPGAPPLRSMILLQAGFLDHPGAQAKLLPHFDADAGVSTAVLWSISDTTLATLDGNGVVTAKCTRSGGSIKVTAKAVADTTVSATVEMGVSPASSCP